MEPTCRRLIWDAGGVIYSFDQNIANKQLAQNCGKSLEEISEVIYGNSMTDRQFNSGIAEPYNLGKINSKEFYSRLKKRLGLTMSYDKFVAVFGNILTLNHKIADLIERVHNAGYTQGVLSSTNPIHWAEMMKLFDIERLLGSERIVRTCDQDAGEKKPSPILFDLVLKKLGGGDKKTFAYFDDVQKYAEAATLYGVNGIYVNITRPDFEENCIATVKSLGIQI